MSDETEEVISTRDAIAAALDDAEAEEKGEVAVEEEPEETQAELDIGDEDDDDEPEEDVEAEPTEATESAADEPVSAEPAEPETAAPDAWKPLAREAWKDVPQEARAEIERREAEIQTKLGELSEQTSRAKAFDEAVAPFAQTISIEAGGDPIAATRNLMGVATRLRFGTAQEKAQLVTQIINQYGVDIETLDATLANQPLPAAGGSQTSSAFPPPAAAADPRIDQMWNMINTQQESARDQAARQVEEFIASKEWGNDVRNDMADLMDLAGRRGEQMTLEQAYDRAVAMRTDLQQITQQRSTATEQTSEESLKRKKRASKQLHSPQSGSTEGDEPATLEDAINKAWDDVASR